MPFVYNMDSPNSILSQYKERPDIATFSISMWNEKLSLHIAQEIKNNEFLRNARYSFYNSMDLYNSDELLIDKIEESMNVCLENLKLVKDKFGYEKNTLKFLDSFFQEITKLLVLTKNIDGIKFLYNYNSKNKEYYGEYLK